MPLKRRPPGPPVLLCSFLLAGSWLTGCAIEGEPEPGLGPPVYICPEVGCGTNSPIIDGSPVHELDEGPTVAAFDGYDDDYDQHGDYNGWGMRIVHLRQHGLIFRVDVRGDHLYGVDQDGNLLKGASLVGATLVLERMGPLMEKTPYYVFFEVYHNNLHFWLGDPLEKIESFRLSWSTLEDPGTAQHYLCPPVDPMGWAGATDHEAIFFQGDRYDPETATVTATGSRAENWFNIACAGSVPAKLHTNRHTRAGAGRGGFDATPLQEQALLKMYTADYCGTGHAHTVLGQPLRWTNSLDWQDLELADPISYEAVWDSTGALCLDDPRMAEDDEEAEEMREQFAAECGLASCAEVFPDFPDGWQDPGYLLTANPP
ncbi:MAG TPA: ADYC domain-containing protein [Kofleriaceae bacterium]|nr:ADYC domain-containing protein [Kofleriaceae bacterium]